MNDITTTSTRPYLLRALHEWCTDNGLTPYLAVQVDKTVQVPMAFVQDGQIVLNVSHDASSGLHMGNDYISFKARFGGKPHDIMLPVGRVFAIYARETGQGMSFPIEPEAAPDESAPEDLLGADPAANRTAPVVQLVHSKPDADAEEGAGLPGAQGAEAAAPTGDDDDTPEPGAPRGRPPALKRVK